MNINEKREELTKVKKNLKRLLKEKDEVTEKVKALTVEDEDFEEIRNRAEELVRVIEDLRRDEGNLEEDIRREEEKLEQVAEDSEKSVKVERKENTMEYLKTKESVIDFANILAKGMDGADTKKAWNEHLKTKGVALADGDVQGFFLPSAVVKEITDIVTDDKGIVDTYFATGFDRFKTAVDLGTMASETHRAKGHKRGTTKAEQTITLTPVEISADIIYKYLTVDKVLLRESKDTGALLKYVMYELPKNIYKEIARASVLGDGRQSNDNAKINSLIPMVSSANYITTTVNWDTQGSLFEQIISTVATIKREGRKFGICSAETLAELRVAKDGSGAYIFRTYEEIASAFGLEKIFTPDWMSADGSPKFIAYVGDAYKLVGDGSLSSYENFLLSQNKEEFLMETYIGGGLTEAYACGVLAVGD